MMKTPPTRHSPDSPRPLQRAAAVAILGAAVVGAACQSFDTTAVNPFESPPPIEGRWFGPLSVTFDVGNRRFSEPLEAVLQLQDYQTGNTIVGTSITGQTPGIFEAQLFARDSSVIVRMLGPAARRALGWAAFLPSLYPGCDWASGEFTAPDGKLSLTLLRIESTAVVTCTDSVITGQVGPQPAQVTVSLLLRSEDETGAGR